MSKWTIVSTVAPDCTVGWRATYLRAGKIYSIADILLKDVPTEHKYYDYAMRMTIIKLKPNIKNTDFCWIPWNGHN